MNGCFSEPAPEDVRKSNLITALKTYDGEQPILDKTTLTDLGQREFDTFTDAWEMAKAAFDAYKKKPADHTKATKMTLEMFVDKFTDALFRDNNNPDNINESKDYGVCFRTLRKLRFQYQLSLYVGQHYITEADAEALAKNHNNNLESFSVVRILATETYKKFNAQAHDNVNQHKVDLSEDFSKGRFLYDSMQASLLIQSYDMCFRKQCDPTLLPIYSGTVSWEKHIILEKCTNGVALTSEVQSNFEKCFKTELEDPIRKKRMIRHKIDLVLSYISDGFFLSKGLLAGWALKSFATVNDVKLFSEMVFTAHEQTSLTEMTAPASFRATSVEKHEEKASSNPVKRISRLTQPTQASMAKVRKLGVKGRSPLPETTDRNITPEGAPTAKEFKTREATPTGEPKTGQQSPPARVKNTKITPKGTPRATPSRLPKGSGKSPSAIASTSSGNRKIGKSTMAKTTPPAKVNSGAQPSRVPTLQKERTSEKSPSPAGITPAPTEKPNTKQLTKAKKSSPAVRNTTPQSKGNPLTTPSRVPKGGEKSPPGIAPTSPGNREIEKSTMAKKTPPAKVNSAATPSNVPTVPNGGTSKKSSSPAGIASKKAKVTGPKPPWI